MTLPLRINEAMQMQVEAERKKRASILESEGKFRSNEETRGFFVLTCTYMWRLYMLHLHMQKNFCPKS